MKKILAIISFSFCATINLPAQLTIPTGFVGKTDKDYRIQSISEKGRYTAVAGETTEGRTLFVWDNTSGKQIFIFSQPYIQIEKIAISEVSNMLAFAFGSGDQHELQIINLQDFSVHLTHNVPLAVHHLQFQPDKHQLVFTTERLLSTDTAPGLYLVDLKTKTVLEKMKFPKADEVGFSLSDHGSQLAIIAAERYGNNNRVVIRALNNYNDSVSFDAFPASAYKAYALPGERWLLAGWNPCDVYIISRKGILAEFSIEAYDKILDLRTDESYIHLLVRNASNGRQTEILSYSLHDYAFVNSFTSTPDHVNLFAPMKERMILVSNHDSLLHAASFSYQPAHVPVRMQVQSNHNESIKTLVAHPSQPLVATYGYDGKIKIWDLRLGMITDELNMDCEGMMFSGEKPELFIHDLSNIFIYDLSTRKIKQTISKKIGNDNKEVTAVGFANKPENWIMHSWQDFTLYRPGATLRTLVKTGKIKETVRELVPLENGMMLYSISNEENKEQLNHYIFNTATIEGKKSASLKINSLIKWSLNKDRTRVLFITTADDKINSSWYYELSVYALPGLQLIEKKRFNEITTVPALNHDFNQVAFVMSDEETGMDQLVVAKFPSKEVIRKIPSPDYLSSAELSWDSSNEFVIVKNSYNYFSTAGRAFVSYKLPNMPPQQVLVDEVKKKLWLSNGRGLWSYNLSTLEKGDHLDRFDMGQLWLPAVSSDHIYYHAYSKNGYEFRIKDSTSKTIFSLRSPNSFFAVQPGQHTWVAHGEKNGKGWIYLSKIDAKGNETRKDSVPGKFPVTFAVSKPLMSCYNAEGDAYLLYDLEQMKALAFSKPLKAQRYTIQPARFLNNDQNLLYAPGGGKINNLNIQSGQLEEQRLDDVSEIRDLTVSPTGKHLLVKSGIKTDFIYLVDMATMLVIKKLAVYETGFTQMQLVNDSIVITNNNDGSLGWHNLFTGKNFLVTMTDADGHIVHFDPESRQYASSRKDPRGMAFVYKSKLVPFIQMDTRLNRPAKVLNMLSYSDKELLALLQHATEKRLKLEGLPLTDPPLDKLDMPEVHIINSDKLPLTTSEKKITINIYARDSVYAMRALHVLVNGNPEFGRKGLQLTPAKIFEKQIELLLSPGMNKIEVYVSNDNGVESLRASFQLESSNKQEEGKTYFIGIGAAEYKDTSMNLTYAAKDIRDLAAAIQQRYPGAVIDTLINEKVQVQHLQKIREKLLKTSINDRVILSYAGHGLLSDRLDFYFATHNINFKKPQDGGWSYEQMEDLLDGIPAREKLMLIDACHSGEVDKEAMLSDTSTQIAGGAVIREKDTRGGRLLKKGKKGGLQNSFELMKQLFAATNAGNGAVVISAAGGKEYALESAEWSNGVFTYSFLNGLLNKHADRNGDGRVSINEIKDYVQQTVPALTRGRQTPTMRQENVMFDWLVW